MGSPWRSSFSSPPPPQGCGTQPLRGGKGGKELDGTGREAGQRAMVGRGEGALNVLRNRARSQEEGLSVSALR